MPRLLSCAIALLLVVGCAGAAAPPPPAAAPESGAASGDVPAAAPAAASSQPLERVTYALPTVSGLFLPPALAEARGFFREEGLQVETPVMRANLLLPALLAGEADYLGAISSAVRGSLSGMPIRIIAAMVDKSSRHLLAVPGVTSLEQLRGQAIAVSAIGDGPYNHGVLAFEYSGFDPGEVTWLAIGQSNERLLAMEQGQVIASIFSAAEIPRAEARGLNTVLRLEAVAPLPQAGMATTAEKIEGQRSQVQRALRAIVRTLQYLHDDRAGSVQFFGQYLGLTPEEAEQAYDAILPGYSSDGTLGERAARAAIDADLRLLKRNDDVPIRDVFDFSPLQEVLPGMGITPPADSLR
ncbi:MAG TPA: ABC transporter substrate-binding protein [Chloroflexota bacterium]|jgi:ABC-type nitrate/sulfonate/bicarbonate transport system substrate-binding protein